MNKYMIVLGKSEGDSLSRTFTNLSHPPCHVGYSIFLVFIGKQCFDLFGKSIFTNSECALLHIGTVSST